MNPSMTSQISPNYLNISASNDCRENFDEHPGGVDGLRVVIPSFIEKWLRVTVVRAGINEQSRTVVEPLSCSREN